MAATVVRATDVRCTETPNATMTTLASPTLSGRSMISLWRVKMEAGASGPIHVFDSDQIWHLLSGGAALTVNGTRLGLETGDTVRIAGQAERQITATVDSEFMVCGQSNAEVSTPTGSHGGTPPWIS